MASIDIQGTEFIINGRWLRILTLRDDLTHDIENPEVIIDACVRKRIPVDMLVFSQSLPDLWPKFSYHMEWDNIAAVPVSTYKHWLMKQIHPNTRNKINKAKKSGIIVKVESLSRKLAEGMVDIFNETPIRRGRRYSYYGRDVETVEKEWAKDLERSDFLVAYHQEEMIGFIQLVYGKQCARTSGTVAKIAHRNKAPMNALLAKAVEVCAEKQIPYLIYGKYIYGNRGEDSLSFFKKNSGFEKIDVPRYFIPLSFWGRLAMNLGLHKGVSSLLPNRTIALMSQIRSQWYGRQKTK
jgi:hypothetical protein